MIDTHARTHAHLLPSMSYTHNTHRVGDWSECRECEGTLNFRKNTWRAGSLGNKLGIGQLNRKYCACFPSLRGGLQGGKEEGRDGGRSESVVKNTRIIVHRLENRSNANANEQISCMHAVMHNQRMHC